MPKAHHPELAAAIGARIREAREAAGFDSQVAMARHLRRDERTFRRWESGSALPGVDVLIAIAEACSVTLDWLCLGHEETPAALTEWVDGCSDSRRASASFARAVGFMRSLPLRGWRVTPDFYEQLYLGIRGGLLEDLSDPADVVRAARETSRLTQR